METTRIRPKPADRLAIYKKILKKIRLEVRENRGSNKPYFDHGFCWAFYKEPKASTNIMHYPELMDYKPSSIDIDDVKRSYWWYPSKESTTKRINILKVVIAQMDKKYGNKKTK